jgi:hypothetical protein
MKGADVGTTSLRIVFQGLDLPVAVVNIRARVNARWPVFDGTSIIVGLGGGAEAISVCLDLDRPDAFTDYFRDHAITIAPDETVVADVYASCRHAAVEWDLLIDFVRSGQTQTIVLNSADHQLRTTGQPAALDAAFARGDSGSEVYRAVVAFEGDHVEVYSRR